VAADSHGDWWSTVTAGPAGSTGHHAGYDEPDTLHRHKPGLYGANGLRYGLPAASDPRPNLSFQLERLGAIRADDESVGQRLVDEGADEAVERQAADGELVLLGWRKALDHEAVTDVHAELVAGAPARGMAGESGPQSLGHDSTAGADLQVLGGHGPTAHADVQQPVASQTVWTPAARLAHKSIREPARQAGTGRDGETAKLLLKRTTVDLRLRDEKGLQRLRA
jgi:hypothetical protein